MIEEKLYTGITEDELDKIYKMIYIIGYLIILLMLMKKEE